MTAYLDAATSLEQYWLRTAYELALNSPDPSTQNGAFLVSTVGFPLPSTGAWNDLPRGVEDDASRWERPAKYQYVEHAERACILKAARLGYPTEGCTMVCAWAACTDCARAIIGAGIRHLITHQADENERWSESIAVAMTMLDEANVRVTTVTGKLGHCAPIRRNGIHVSP